MGVNNQLAQVINDKEISECVEKLRTMNRLRMIVLDTFDVLYQFDNDFSFLEHVNELPEEVYIGFKYKDKKQNFEIANPIKSQNDN
ncbi:hypothetical protein E8M24_24765 [Bacillus thuringiensis]|uniref:hypothetical protein n=1 Tax=Bacillus thuringiensis TaxID=1428 RepID=UPI00125F915B|nr:hypothetical protein [Bacillus thuringiensis]KAB5636903.1 hypothetical protein E8M24_24765 [Bacillus thuringiensis]HDR5270911.1 hypothetical protein [Bacillus thuringiensis]